MKLAVAYCRVSTDSEEQKKSITEQRSQWEEFFKETNTTSAKCGLLYKRDGTKEILSGGIYVDEGISGTSLRNRGAFNQMLVDSKLKKFDMIYVEDISRFSRSVEDGIRIIKDLRELGIGVYFRKEGWNTLNENKDFEFALRISIAQEESRVKSERLKWAINRLHKKGGWNGAPPYGYEVDNAYLVINEDEADVVKEIFDLYLNKGYGYGKIARYLNDKGIPTKKGVLWSQIQIKTILEYKLYTGEQRTHTEESYDITRQLRKEVPKDEQIVHQLEELRIIDDETFSLTQIELKNRRDKYRNGTGHSNRHLLSTLLYCSNCGGTLKRKKISTYVRKDGTRKDLGYEWACGINDMYGKIKCGHRNSMREVNITEIIKNELKHRKKDNLDDIFTMYLDKRFKDDINISSLNKEKERLVLEMGLLREDKLDELVSEDIYKEQMKTLNNRLIDINAEISRYDRRKFEIKNSQLRYDEYIKMINSIDVETITNAQLKKIFSKILVKERIVKGDKEKYVCFVYRFLDITIEELFEGNEGLNIWIKVS